MRVKRAIVVLTLGVLVFSIVTIAMQLLILAGVQTSVPRAELTARISEIGYVNFCLNNPPNITFGCNATLSQNISYSCQLNASDVDGQNTTVSVFFTAGDPFFNVTSGGLINVTPTNEDVGNHTARFSVDDNLGCTNSQANVTVDLAVLNVNDPPYLIEDIPDQEFRANTTLSAFFLDDYFADPDGDALTYTSSTPTYVTVVIMPSSEVRFTSSVCVEELVTFTATDPYNASASSNAVEIEVSCPRGGGRGDSESEAGGGGGGGGADICLSRWECEEWFDCLPAGIQWQRCYDLNACEVDRYLKRQCTYTGPPPLCEENWLCSAWDPCAMNGTQARSCEDLRACGTAIVKPAESQACIYAPTCADGVRNGDEEDIDCGGSCPACGLVQRPSIIGAQGLSAWLLALLIIGVLLATAAIRYYQAEIARAIATLGFLLRHRIVKDVLLDAAQRKMLFERVRAFEQREPASKEEIYDDLGMLIRAFLHEALGLPVEAAKEEFAARIAKLRLHAHTAAMLQGMAEKLDVLEREELVPDPYFVLATLEQVRTAVCLTSQYEQAEILRPLEEVPLTPAMSFFDEIFARNVNVLRAVQFGQTEIARKEYVELLSRYEPLSEDEREAIYPELVWVFQATRLQSEVTGARIVAKP